MAVSTTPYKPIAVLDAVSFKLCVFNYNVRCRPASGFNPRSWPCKAAQTTLASLRPQTGCLHKRLQLDALTGSLPMQSLQSLNAQLDPCNSSFNLKESP